MKRNKNNLKYCKPFYVCTQFIFELILSTSFYLSNLIANKTNKKPKRYISVKLSAIGNIHVISPYFGGSSLYFAHFWENLPSKISEFPSMSYTSPYLEFQVSLPKFENFLLCLIILPIWKRKSPYLSFQMYHMYKFGNQPSS